MLCPLIGSAFYTETVQYNIKIELKPSSCLNVHFTIGLMVPLRSECPPFRVMACIFVSPDPCTISFCDMSHKVNWLTAFTRWNRSPLTPVQEHSVVLTTFSVDRWKQKGAALHGNSTNRKNIWSISFFVNHHYYHDEDVCSDWTGPGITGFTLLLLKCAMHVTYHPPGCPCSCSISHHLEADGPPTYRTFSTSAQV